MAFRAAAPAEFETSFEIFARVLLMYGEPGYRASVDGDRFVSRHNELLTAGSSLLIMSADAGG